MVYDVVGMLIPGPLYSVFKQTEKCHLTIPQPLSRGSTDPVLAYLRTINDDHVNTITQFLGQRDFLRRAVNPSPVLTLTSTSGRKNNSLFIPLSTSRVILSTSRVVLSTSRFVRLNYYYLEGNVCYPIQAEAWLKSFWICFIDSLIHCYGNEMSVRQQHWQNLPTRSIFCPSEVFISR